nr:adenylyltransferase/cytidyltransferase family protein [Nanoarchaeota archaeon]
MSRKVAVWGTFDKLHLGHIEFLRNAKKLGCELYVVIVPDKSVKENKGKLPKYSATERKNNILRLDFVKEAYVDCLSDGLESIINLRPEVFAFGHDQTTKWEKKLRDHLKQNGLSQTYIYLPAYSKGKPSSDLEKLSKQ